MQAIAQKNTKTAAHNHVSLAPYFSVAQQVMRMEWEGGHSANPNPERVSLRDLPRIDQWWLAGRPMNPKSQ